jgi:hypothetical protein
MTPGANMERSIFFINHRDGVAMKRRLSAKMSRFRRQL